MKMNSRDHREKDLRMQRLQLKIKRAKSKGDTFWGFAAWRGSTDWDCYLSKCTNAEVHFLGRKHRVISKPETAPCGEPCALGPSYGLTICRDPSTHSTQLAAGCLASIPNFTLQSALCIEGFHICWFNQPQMENTQKKTMPASSRSKTWICYVMAIIYVAFTSCRYYKSS